MSVLEVLRYEDDSGHTPLTEWLRRLRDKAGRAQIEIRLNRLADGNFGRCDPVGEGVLELKIDFGPGYRVYFARVGQAVVVLLCGGDKRSQDLDIKRAKIFWADWKRSNR